MNDKARGRTFKRRKNMTPFWVALCTLLVLGAVIAGFLYAGDLIDTVGSPPGTEASTAEPEKETNISLCDSELIFGVSPDAGKIDSLILCRLDSGEGKLRFDLIDPGMSYNMSGSLYSELSLLNIRIPQTGRFGGLIGYCSEDGAYDAGRKIAAELLAVDIGHYSCFDSRTLDEYISISGKEGEKKLLLKVDTSEAKSAAYGTPGTAMGFIKEFFGKTLKSDRTVDDRMVYLEVVDALENSDISAGTVPVTRHNETMELDVRGWHAAGAVK